MPNHIGVLPHSDWVGTAIRSRDYVALGRLGLSTHKVETRVLPRKASQRGANPRFLPYVASK